MPLTSAIPTILTTFHFSFLTSNNMLFLDFLKKGLDFFFLLDKFRNW